MVYDCYYYWWSEGCWQWCQHYYCAPYDRFCFAMIATLWFNAFACAICRLALRQTNPPGCPSLYIISTTFFLLRLVFRLYLELYISHVIFHLIFIIPLLFHVLTALPILTHQYMFDYFYYYLIYSSIYLLLYFLLLLLSLSLLLL